MNAFLEEEDLGNSTYSGSNSNNSDGDGGTKGQVEGEHDNDNDDEHPVFDASVFATRLATRLELLSCSPWNSRTSTT